MRGYQGIGQCASTLRLRRPITRVLRAVFHHPSIFFQHLESALQHFLGEVVPSPYHRD